MTTEDLMKLADAYARLNAQTTAPGAGDARQSLLDALEALGREVAELKLRAGNGYSRKIEELIAERDQARAELAAIRAQEPVATIEISVRGSTTTIDNHFSDVVRDLPEGKYQLYASPATKDAGLVADGWKLVPVEPTPEMIAAIWAYKSGNLQDCYRAMLAASPTIGGV